MVLCVLMCLYFSTCDTYISKGNGIVLAIGQPEDHKVKWVHIIPDKNKKTKTEEHIIAHHAFSTGLDGIIAFHHCRSFSAEQTAW